MMSSVFLKIINLSYSASWLILAVIAARLLLKRAPKWVSCIMWGLVALRLIIPFTLNSALSLLPSSEVVPSNIEMTDTPHIEFGIAILNNTVNQAIENTLAPTEAASVNPMQVVVFIASAVWITGMIVMMLYALFSYVLIRIRTKESAYVSKGLRECDEIESPFILGIFRPVIYVPSGMNQDTLKLVLAHEQAHLHRFDHLWKPLGFLLLSVYWFNPLCWVAYILLCRDIESACDEKVIGGKSNEYMAAYSQALLDCSVQRRRIAACPVAFGETGVKMRIKNVLNYKKPAFWLVMVSLAVCVIVAACFLTNPGRSVNAEEMSAADTGAVTDPQMVSDSQTAGDPQTVSNSQTAGDATGTVFDEIRVYYFSGNHFSEGGLDPDNLIDFSITFSPDGTYSWYETPISSFIGIGTYSIKDGILTMTDNAEMTGTGRVNSFTVSGDRLYYIADGSDNFLMVKLDDNAEFLLGVNPAEGWLDNVSEPETYTFVWPTEKEIITAGFSTEEEHYHPETDLAGEIGDPIYAAMAGTITETGFDDKYGNYIIETFGDIKITYCHLEEVNVSENDVVASGDVIGTMGSTGRSTGPHLAIRLLIGDEPQDFAEYFDAEGSDEDN